VGEGRGRVNENADEAKLLGRLDIVEPQLNDKQKFADFQTEIKAENFNSAFVWCNLNKICVRNNLLIPYNSLCGI